MAVPTQLSDLSATAASNSPAGGDTVGTTMDDYLRAIQSIIVRISAGTDAMATPNVGAATGTSLVLSGLATVNGAFTSLGLDDNATAKALTLSGSGANSITIANSVTNPTIGTSGGGLKIATPASGETSHVLITSNVAGATPVQSTATGLILASNHSNGNGESNFYNPLYTAAVSFDFRQITASGVSSSVLRIVPIASGTESVTITQGNASTNAKIRTSAASNLVLGLGIALATTDTTNHIMIPTCAGTPTGVPVGAGAGQLAIIYDTTNDFLYIYNGGWKKSTAYA